MRIGVMGGTLDPVHNGHLQIARAVLEKLRLDHVLLLPAGDPPHKRQTTLKEERLEMARLAAQETEGLVLCAIEIMREGTTYTVDTLRELSSGDPSAEWFYIIGADTLDVLDTWRCFEEVAGMCIFAVVGRADMPANQEKMRELTEKYGASFEEIDFCGPDISSSEIRERVAEGLDVSRLVPASVYRYIGQRGLYKKQLAAAEIMEMLKADLKPSRFAHTLGVAQTAKRLAPRFGIDENRAELAALLHDCAKSMPIEEMRSMVTACVPDADAQELETVNVLHAPAGAVLAARKYGVRDREILSAIRKHTLGDVHMSPLEALIYTSDFIEPTRVPFTGLEQARELAESDLYAATRLCARLTNDYLESQGKLPHPKSLAMLNITEPID